MAWRNNAVAASLCCQGNTMTDRTLSLYNGEVTLAFSGDPQHCYMWREIGKPVRAFSSIKERLGIGPAIAQWQVNMAIQHIKDNLCLGIQEGDTLPPMSLEWLEEICREAKTAARRSAKQAANIGTIVHKFAERVLVDRRAAIPSDPQAAKGAAAFLDWLHSHQVDPINTERMVLSRRWYYAGTVDFFGRIDEELCVLDFKTSSGFYIEMPLQLAAYAIALEEELGLKIDKGLIVRLDKKTGKCQVYTVELTRATKDAFIRLAELDQLMTKLEDQIDAIRAKAA